MINGMKSNKNKCQVLHLGWSSAGNQYKVGEEWLGSSPAARDLGVLADSRLSVRQQRALAALCRGQTSAPWGASNTARPDGQQRGSSRGVQRCVTSPGVVCIFSFCRFISLLKSRKFFCKVALR